MLQKLKNTYHMLQSVAASIYFGMPSTKLKVIGITGTDGKTSTTSLIYHILSKSGKKSSMITTVYAKIGGKEYDTGLHTTTPDAFAAQKYLRKAVDNNDEYFILETTSHALDQHRNYGVQFEIGIITNITHEHLDWHKTYDNYLKAKFKLLLRSRGILINRDDQSYTKLVELLKIHNKEFKTYGLENKADYNIEIAKEIGLPLTEFNKYNYLAAYAVCKELGIDDKDIFKAMKTFALPPGRFETVYDQDFKVIVDFAHTPNAMVELLKSVQKLYPDRRIINVFGSAGYRDATKRPAMGEASGTYSNLTIITEDDPRTEGAEKIAHEIEQGILRKGFKLTKESSFGDTNKTYYIQPDRKLAIEKAISIAKKGDIVVFNGKGHEKSIARENREDPWNDKEETLKAVQKLRGHNK